MGIGSIGSVSFWQQDQNFWQQAQAQDQASTASNALITAMGSLMTNEVKGLASIANQTALDRVNSELEAAAQSAVQSQTSGSTSSNGASTPASTTGSPATGTGTIPLTGGTSLLTLGIAPNSTISVSDGTNTTNFNPTTDSTVGDLINAINTAGPKNAQVTAWLNGAGNLVVAAQNKTVSVTVGGTFASDIGFGAKNDSFQPVAPSSSASSNSSSSGSSSSAAASSTGTSSSSSPSPNTPTVSTASLFNSAYALQTGGTAETLLASTGAGGSLLNLLA
jgi:hypothetical protein